MRFAATPRSPRSIAPRTSKSGKRAAVARQLVDTAVFAGPNVMHGIQPVAPVNAMVPIVSMTTTQSRCKSHRGQRLFAILTHLLTMPTLPDAMVLAQNFLKRFTTSLVCSRLHTVRKSVHILQQVHHNRYPIRNIATLYSMIQAMTITLQTAMNPNSNIAAGVASTLF